MQLVATDILAEAHGLSMTVCIVGIVLGMLLGGTGWLARRFWVVLGATLSGGLVGLLYGASYDVQPMVAGLGLAVAFGILSVFLIRFIVYVTVAFTCLFAVHMRFPQFDYPGLVLLVGGLFGLYLYRFWIMAITATLGGMMIVYSVVCLVDGLGKRDMIDWANRNAMLLNLACIGVVSFYVVGQFFIDQKIQGWKKGWQSTGQPKVAGQDQLKGGEKAKGGRNILDARKWLSKGWDKLRKAG
jgi:hypothetical protein